MEILISFAEKVAECTVAPIGRQAGYLIFYKGNFKKLADDIKELEDARERMNHLVEEERRNGKVIESDVQHWLETVNEVIEKANQLQKDPRHGKVGCSGSSFPNLLFRHQLSRNAKKMVIAAAEVNRKGNFDRVGYRPAVDDNVTTVGGVKLETRELHKEDIMRALRDPKVHNIGVYGLGGVGKTNLVKKISEIAKQEKLFEVVVMANVSKTPDIKTIQGEIADVLGLRFEEETIAGRANRLRQRIKAEKTVLVILDDIWTKLDLEKVGIPFGIEHNGFFKLLMTSRSKEVLLELDAQKDFTFRLDVLNEEEAWNLFLSMAGNVVKDISLQNIAIQIAQKCAGLPLRIVTIARALKNKDVHAWNDALRQLESIDHTEMDALTFSALELSYNWLESDEIKALFLLFAVLKFQGAEYLLKVAIGLNIFKRINTVDDARNRLYKIIGYLKASCLLLEGNTSEQIQMHDIVREVAVSIASRDQHVFVMNRNDELKEWPTKDFLNRCTQIIILWCHIHELLQRLDCPNIKYFLLSSVNRSLELPDTIFEGMGSLKVLDLGGMNLSSLPTSFRSLTNLQTLCLDFCVLENMDAIGALKNLEILRLYKSSMVKLPNEIKKLTHLRMLDLSNSGIEVIPPNIISSLTKLEELHMGNTSIKWEIENSAKLNENASLAELRQLSNLTGLELQIPEAWILPRDLKLMFEKLKRYKIVIGDVWEWSDIADGTLKTLKLKLGTTIHLEHGIKALIKGVDNLYLDEVDGIWNVLYQLNGEGFPLLKHLHVQNNAKMKHIVDSLGRNQVPVSFPHLETLVLHNLKNMEQICHGPLAVNSFGKLSIIKVKNCIQLKYLLSFSMVKGLSQLSEIQVCQCNSMKKVVLGDGDSCTDNNIVIEKVEFLSIRSLTLQDLQTLDNFFSYELMSSFTEGQDQRCETSVPAPFFSAQVAFPNLDTLKLSSLNLNKVWDDNKHSMDNLTNLIVENCGRLKYLFSSTMVESFMNLKRLEISKCHLMDEIIATIEKKNGTSAMKEVRFSKLETIILKDMENLKTIWHHQFNTLKMLQVQNCEKIVVVFPSSMQKTYDNLEVLEVTDCASVEKIFELTANEKSNVEDKTQLKKIILDGLPKLKNTWNKDPQGILSFHNLENIYLRHCGSLEYLFPLSVATYCSHLEELCIQWCRNMKEIVAEKKESVCTPPIFEFNRLTTLRLWKLHKLKGLYAGNYTLACPSLIKIDVSRCAKLNLFKILSTPSLGRFQDGKFPVSVEQSLFIIEEVIPNLEMLKMGPRDANMILQAEHFDALLTKMTILGLSDFKNEEAAFPYRLLQNVPSLETLVVEWSSFTKIFQDERLVSEKNCTRLKRLTLNQLPKLQNICEEGSQLDPVLEVLEYLDVAGCPSLKYLLPSSVTFNHMTYLEITHCNGLVYLITSHTARSLAKLRILNVKNCNSLEEIITGKEDVGIAFVSLEILVLENLPRLNKFYSGKRCLNFPLLEEVIVMECTRMKIFSEGNTSTPNLRTVKIAENDEERLWKGDLNGTIYNMFEDKVAFGSFQSLKLSEYPELKELWYGQLEHNIFRHLKRLEVHECDFLSDVLFQPNLLEVLMNLEELDVRYCTSLEAVFDVNSKFTTEILMKNSTRLKKLTLSSLPKLKQVWKGDPHETLSFQNLCEIFVMECERLTSLFPFSIATDIMQLHTLQVHECGIEEIVAKEEGTEDIMKFMFPHLTSLDLRYLPKLRTFFTGIHSLRCKSLKNICVFDCPKLELFRTKPMNYQERAREDKLYVSTYQPLFTLEEVVANVEHLTLNNKDFDMISKSQYSGDQFKKLRSFKVSRFTNEETTFLYWFLRNAPNLEVLVVQWSSFTEIFQDEGHIGKEREIKSSTQLRMLTLYQLHGLRHICQEGSQIDSVLEVLEFLNVDGCPSLRNLLPSSVTFNHMTYLEVTNCNGLLYLITSPVARSLAKLKTMKVNNCNSLEEIIKRMEDVDIAFVNLETLMLECLPRLNKFCSSKCCLDFPLLDEVVVRECARMKIFSEGNISTPSLQKVKIVENDEEWHWKGDLNGTINNMFEDKAAFGSFQSLKLSEYPELRELWYGQLQHNIFRHLKRLEAYECDFLSDVLFQPNLLEVLMNLEELDVRDCTSLEAVFDVKSKFTTEILMKNSTRLKKLTLSSLPKLKHVWKEDPQETLRFQNLCEVSIMECERLTSLFPFSIATDIMQLHNLQVHECGIEEIVAKEEGTEDIMKFMFPHLTSLDLRYLPKLKAFFTGIHSLRCKSLKSIDVFDCPKLELFKTEPMSYQERARDDKLYVSNYQPLFTLEEVLANVENLRLNNKDFDMILQSQYSGDQFSKLKSISVSQFTNEEATFPYWFMKNVPILEKLLVEWSSFTEIFQDEELVSDERNIRIHTRLRDLTLHQLHGLRHICKEGFQIDPVLQLLETIDVDQCCSLINLLPSSATFIHLTCLTVSNCNGLINLIACSTAKSLVKLTTMKIEACNLLEDVVNGKEDETNNDIDFCNLQTLELISLPRLHRFCPCKCFIKFPLLEEVVVKECPRMHIFSSGDISIPNLQKVQIEDDEEYCREGDLNGTIKKMFEDKVVFYKLKHLKLSEYPELKDLWYGQLHHNVFCNLKSLVVHRCDFLSSVLFPSNVFQVLHGLEELEVKDCDSLETVFDVKSVRSKEILVKQTAHLKRLTLFGLPKLKHIWNEDPHKIISFGNLSIVDISECQNLSNIFSLLLCQDLGHLEILDIESCGVEEVVAIAAGSIKNSFYFPQLTKLRLCCLTKLKSFYPGKHTLECPSLKILNVYCCDALRMFSFNHLNFKELDQVDEIHEMDQALFSIEKISPNLEELALDGKDALRILNGCCQKNLFNKVELLRLQCFDETPTTYMNCFHAIFPNLATLQVRRSSFDTLFIPEGMGHFNTQSACQINKLWLYELEQLRYIWQEDFPLDHLVHDLEDLTVINCPNLISMVPSSTSLKNLTILEVENCEGLIYLITSSAAKSLVQLTTLKIKKCEKILDVIKIDEEKAEKDIIFENLEYLKLTSLSSFRSFCYGKHTLVFPSLLRLVVKGCPEMKIFSSGVIVAPFLTAIEVENKRMRWKDDLNTTIEQLFIEQEVSRSDEK